MIFNTFSASIFKCFGKSRFLDFGSHYRRPRGPTGGLRGSIFAASGSQQFWRTTAFPFRIAPGSIRATILHSKRSVDRLFIFCIDFSFHLVPFLHIFGVYFLTEASFYFRDASIFLISFWHWFWFDVRSHDHCLFILLILSLVSCTLTYHEP